MDSVTLNAIYTMLKHSKDILNMDFYNEKTLLRSIRKFCYEHQTAFDEDDIDIVRLILDRKVTNPDWNALIQVAYAIREYLLK